MKPEPAGLDQTTSRHAQLVTMMMTNGTMGLAPQSTAAATTKKPPASRTSCLTHGRARRVARPRVPQERRMNAPRNPDAAALEEALIKAHTDRARTPDQSVAASERSQPKRSTSDRPLSRPSAHCWRPVAQRAERRQKRRLIDARDPQIENLPKDFRFQDNPEVPKATIRRLRG